MAKITISNLLPAGTSLFSDSESFLSDLSSEELQSRGGLPTSFMPSIITITILQEDLFLSIGVTIPATR